ncbi:MAG: hypothetical protein ACTSRP_17010 [Candidatus Helarchaeota archaeon]
MLNSVKLKIIAKKYQISKAQVSTLKAKISASIRRLRGVDSLVLKPQKDTAIGIDEIFMKIEGITIYIIIAISYTSHKVLDIKVSKTHTEEDKREIFDEADRNIVDRISVVTSDAHPAPQSIVKNLGREIAYIIHIHKNHLKKWL